MRELFARERSLLPLHDLTFLAGVPVVHHCHHFNLFWDQTIDDALGTELGTSIRTRAAREAFHDLLAGLALARGAADPAERVGLGEDVFRHLGQGTLRLDANPDGGVAYGDYLHYGHAWNEKYGGKIRRRRPADAFAAGAAAATLEVAHGLRRESVDATERACVAMRDPRCAFQLRPGEPAPSLTPVRRAEIERHLCPSFDGLFEDEIGAVSRPIREATAELSGDARGLIQAFGLFLTLHPATYYNRSGYDAFRAIARSAPQSVGVMKALLRESGHVCAFNTFGNILLSPEWEALFGPPRGEIEEIVTASMGLARALGFGRWCIAELDPERRFVLRTPSTYESGYYASREGRASEGMCFFVQGAALAIMQLAHRVPWRARPSLSQTFYDELFRAALPWHVEETSCVARGDVFCEVVVEPRPTTASSSP